MAGGDGEDGETAVGQTSGWVLGYSPEYAQFEANPQLLAQLAAETGGQDLSGNETAVFAHTLPSEATTRPIWPWLTLLAVILLPFDIAVRRLVITRRDWQRAWAATFGRLQPQPAVQPERTEQVARLFQAKQRAGTNAPPQRPTAPPAPAASESPASQEAPPQEPQKRPSAPAPQPKSTTGGSSLASRLLQKKKEQQSGEDE